MRPSNVYWMFKLENNLVENTGRMEEVAFQNINIRGAVVSVYVACKLNPLLWGIINKVLPIDNINGFSLYSRILRKIYSVSFFNFYLKGPHSVYIWSKTTILRIRIIDDIIVRFHQVQIIQQVSPISKDHCFIPELPKCTLKLYLILINLPASSIKTIDHDLHCYHFYGNKCVPRLLPSYYKYL